MASFRKLLHNTPLPHHTSSALYKVDGVMLWILDWIWFGLRIQIAGEPDLNYHRSLWGVPMRNAYSHNFQWLPREVDTSTENSR